jgi:tetratricopeptide (TPR) repeat protein
MKHKKIKQNRDEAFKTAMATHKKGDIETARAIYEKILINNPNHAPSLHLLGVVFKSEGNRERFYEMTRQALALEPKYAAAWSNLANALKEDKKLDEARHAAQKAVSADARMAEAWNVLGLIEHQLGDMKCAIKSFAMALEIDSENVEYQSNYAAALHTNDEDDEAYQWYLKAIETDPSHHRVCNNLGVLLKDRRQPENSILLYRRALERFPSYADAHWNLSLALLMIEKYEDGWKEYEWRWQRSDCVEKRPDHPFKELTPDDEWKDKKLFIYAEQGMGDTLQFIRYLEPLSAEASVYFAPQKLLMPLLNEQEWKSVNLVDFSAVPADIEYALPLMSIPYIFPKIAKIPSYKDRYIYPNKQRQTTIRPILENDRLNIGLCWQGSRNKIDKGRSIPLKQLVPITQIEGVRAYSLQRKDGTEQLDPPPNGIQLRVFDENLDKDGAFVDTAAIIENLDLVITTDTAMAHLAGGMGKEVWVMLQYVPDWRWGIDGDTTPWYPQARLYRQCAAGDWADVIRRICLDLRSRSQIKLKNIGSV